MPAANQSLPAGELTLRKEAIVAGVIGLVAALFPFHRALVFPFALDDYTFLFKAAGIDPAPFEVRRWLTVTGYYELGWKLFGTNVLPWHLVSFALHAGNTVWVYLLGRRFGVSRNAAWIACGLFASSPLAFTVMYWIAGIQEISSTFFLLGSVWFAMQSDGRRWLSVPIFAAAVLCKESVMAAPLVLPLLLGRNVLRLAIAELVIGVGLFFAAGLHRRALESAIELPYATSYGAPFFINLATIAVWFASPWRPYPDRVAGPQTSLVLPAVAMLGALVVGQLVTRGRTLRPMLLASAWFVALLLPVLPLKQHTFAYYAYAAQIGWLFLIAIAIERAALRFGRRGTEGVLAAGALAVVLSIFLAARNTRTHETLMLQTSTVPHDAVVRYGRAAGAMAAAAREAQATHPGLQRIAFFCFPEQLGTAARTPGRADPGMIRVRKLPIREALRGGRLVSLHTPGVTGVWADSLSPSLEGPETMIYFASGFNDLTPIPDVPQAYSLQAQGNLLIEDRAAAERDLLRALTFAPSHSTSRLLLAGLRIEAGRAEEARPLLEGLRPEDLPAEMRPYLVELRKVLGG